MKKNIVLSKYMLGPKSTCAQVDFPRSTWVWPTAHAGPLGHSGFSLRCHGGSTLPILEDKVSFDICEIFLLQWTVVKDFNTV